MSFFKNTRAVSTVAMVLIIVIAAAVVVSALYVTGTWPFRKTITREEDFTDFTIVDVGSAFHVEITQSNSFSIKIIANENVMDHIEVTKTDETLTIGIEQGFQILAVTLRADITMPELHELRFSGATQGTATGFSSTHNLSLTLSGASSLNPDISAGYLDITVSGASRLDGDLTASEDAELIIEGASTVDLTGGAEDLQVGYCSGGSVLELTNFPVNDADVNVSGASTATVRLDGRLDADVSGASHLYYIGNPTMGDIVTSGDSTVSEK